LQHLLLVDLGGSSLKAGIYNLHSECLAFAQIANRIDEDVTGRAEQDPDIWWHALQQAAEDLFVQEREAFEQVAAIVICGFTRSQVFLNKEGQSIRPAMVFRDCRAGIQVRQALMRPEMREYKAAHHFNPYHPLARLLWLKDNEVSHWHALAHVIEPKDYLNYKLTDKIFSDPISQFWLVQAMREGKPSLWQRVGLGVGLESRNLIPPLRQPYQHIGQVQAYLPGALAILQGVPVFCGAPDTWTAAAGLDALRAGCGYGISGSSEVFGLLSPMPAEAQGLITIPWGDNLWQIGGPGQNGANILDWMVHHLDDSKKPFSEKLEEMLKLQSGQPLLFYPFLYGERTPFWDGDLRAAFLGLSAAHQRGDQIRAVMEGVAFVNRQVLERAEEACGQKAQEIRLAGGGTRSPVWNQIRANILQRPVMVAKTHEMGLRGALAIARLGLTHLGLDCTEDTTISPIREEENFEHYLPQDDNSATYDALYKLFQDHLPMVKEVSHRLGELGMITV